MGAGELNNTIFTKVLAFLLRRLGRLKVEGLEHLNGPGGKVIVCNHVGWSDPLWIGLAALPRKIHQMAKKELFEHPVSAWFVRSGGGFPVDRSNPSPAAIKQAITIVKREGLLLIFPTGTRAKEQSEAKRGAASIALRGATAIVPAYFEGLDRIQLRHLMRRPRVQVTFGKPIQIAEDMRSDKTMARTLTLHLEDAMDVLAKEAALKSSHT